LVDPAPVQGRVETARDIQPAETEPIAAAAEAISTAEAIEVAPLLPIREWTSLNGKYTTRARLINAVADVAYLQEEEPKKNVAVPLSRLSIGDQAYVASRHDENVLNGKAGGVQAGDLIAVRADKTYRIRLDGIDAPEKQQHFFEKSRRALKDK